MASRTYRSEIEIAAPAARVWAVLVDLEGYPRWNPFTVAMKSSLVPGGPIDMKVRMSRWGITISQRETVREATPPEGDRSGRLVWGADMLGVKAQRVQRVETIDAARSRYVTEDTIEGPLGSMVFALFGGSLEDGFDGVARALAQEATSTRA